MKKIILLTLVVSVYPVEVGASSPHCKRRLTFNEPILGAVQKKMIEEQGSSAFIGALKTGELEDTYFLPLHMIEVTDKDDDTKKTIAEIIGNLDEKRSDEKKIMDAYFSQPFGRSYLEELLCKMSLEESAKFLTQCPFVAEYVDPFAVVVVDEHSLGFYVEKELSSDNEDAQAIKKIYDTRDTTWDHYRSVHSDNPELEILKLYCAGVELMKKIQEIYNREHTRGVIQAFLQGTISDLAYDLNLDQCIVRTRTGKEVSLASCIRKRIQQGTSDKEDALRMYQLYAVRGGVSHARTLMLKAKCSGNLAEVANEIEWCPTLGRYLFDPEIDLEKVIENYGKRGDSHAQKIKVIMVPDVWKSHKEYYRHVRHLQKCIKVNKLDDEGLEILKAPDEACKPYIQMIVRDMPKVIHMAVSADDKRMIEDVESWLRGLDEAGIEFDDVQGYKAQLIKRKEELEKLGAQKKATSTPEEKKDTPWLTPTKAFFIGAAGVVGYFVFDQMKSYLQQNDTKKPGSFDEAYERFENNIR